MKAVKNLVNMALGVGFETLFAVLTIAWASVICLIVIFLYP